MSVDLTWPDLLPPATLAGYGIDDDPKVISTDMEVGDARNRRTSTQMSSDLSMQWEFSLFEFAIFEAWLRHRANYVSWFNMEYLAGLGIVWCEAHFKKGKAPVKFQNGERVIVTATMVVRDRPMLDAGDLGVLLEIDASALMAALAASHGPLSTGLPGTPYFWDWR